MVSGFRVLGSLFDTWSSSVDPTRGTCVLILFSSFLRPEASSSTIQTFVCVWSLQSPSLRYAIVGNSLRYSSVLDRDKGVLLTCPSWITPPHAEIVMT